MSSSIIIFMLYAEIVICAYALFRNEWVGKKRQEILESDEYVYGKHIYDLLPSYKDMVSGHGFHRWDINYYLKQGRQNEVDKNRLS